MNTPEARIRQAVTQARIERRIARLTELSDEQLGGIEANLFDLGDLRARCRGCAYLYRPYLESCPTCTRRSAARP